MTEKHAHDERFAAPASRAFSRPGLAVAFDVRLFALRLLKGSSFYLAVAFLFALFFAVRHTCPQVMALAALPCGAILGVAVACFDYLLQGLSRDLRRRLDPFLAGFLLFFAFLLGYIVLSSLLVSYPMGVLMRSRGWGDADLIREFGLLFLNIMALLAILAWLRTLRRVSLSGSAA